ncbi:very-short-patch-repair endonuclease [Cryobacterium mesophilum]|uniref:DUF559 domain-containing protein n=1 Tax=Terrimesophilobacter mesophilus TaxID=433647 RepID=A0A4R8VBG8_9MICO|nr:hypothetical protein [Terrimesophilobacter mesophilus]MBB5633434.1 very-short-patch-repair endonuclease [Terrimesophilobacter mesophilus]TFB80153.1 hypothetical protein E3N84_08955 [Terrimesophilobacter mesophilus]
MPRIPLPARFASGPFTIRQGEEAGLGAKRMRGRDLQRPFRGVRVHTGRPLTFEERCLAYQLRMPPSAFFCGPTAARIMGVPLPLPFEQSDLLHVAVPVGRRAPAGRGIRGHTLGVEPGDIRRWNGLRISGPETTWRQLGAMLGLADLVAAGDFLVHHRLPFTTRELLAAAVEGGPARRGLRMLRQALPLLDDRAESPQESRLRVILVIGGIRGIVANLPITTSGGFRYRADLAIPDRKVIVEYQSRFHDGSAEFRADMTRTSRLEADGWFVMQVNRDDLDGAPELVARLTLVLAGRRSAH